MSEEESVEEEEKSCQNDHHDNINIINDNNNKKCVSMTTINFTMIYIYTTMVTTCVSTCVIIGHALYGSQNARISATAFI